MRYVCKKCGKFVSKDADHCKSCGTENPAVLQSERTSAVPVRSVPSESADAVGGHAEQSRHGGVGRQIVGLIVILVIGFNIYRACSGSGSAPTTGQKSSSTATESYRDEYDSYSSEMQVPMATDDAQSVTSSQNIPIRQWRSVKQRLVFRTPGDAELTYYWVISTLTGSMTFQYIVADNKEHHVLKSGNCVVLTFGELKQQSPNAVLRGGSVSSSSKIALMGPIDEHIDWDGTNKRDVYAILVPHDERAEVYINDTDNPDAFMLLDRLVLQR